MPNRASRTMKCSRCHNLLFPVALEKHDSGLRWLRAWRCYACGNVIDSIILRHQNGSAWFGTSTCNVRDAPSWGGWCSPPYIRPKEYRVHAPENLPNPYAPKQWPPILKTSENTSPHLRRIPKWCDRAVFWGMPGALIKMQGTASANLLRFI